MSRGGLTWAAIAALALGCSGSVGSTASGDGGARADATASLDGASMGDGPATHDVGEVPTTVEGALAARRRAVRAGSAV